MREETEQYYQLIISESKTIFKVKSQDYGTAWRILRLPSITDQILIKAKRIRSIQEKKTSKIDEGISEEFFGIINYSMMALIQIQLLDVKEATVPEEELLMAYDHATEHTLSLLKAKNHDYDEAWRGMRLSSITDIILMKLMRIKQIEDNHGQTLISEGTEAGYQDIINYAVFSLIKIKYC